MEYYFIIKKNEVLIHASTQMNLEQSARSQLQKVTLCMIPFIQTVQDRQIYIDKKIGGCLGLEVVRGKWSLIANGYRLSGVMKMF